VHDMCVSYVNMEIDGISRPRTPPSPSFSGDVQEVDCCATLLTVISWVIIGLTVPFSFFFCFKVRFRFFRVLQVRVGEYGEREV
jgi:hypothetical protein